MTKKRKAERREHQTPTRVRFQALIDAGFSQQKAAKEVLLVPLTEVLLNSRDEESNTLYADLAGSEEFLGSHVLRIPPTTASANGSKDVSTIRENRGKAKQYTTFNGRTVVVKDAFVFSNKGFKSLNQAQLLHDVLWYPDAPDARQWLIYFISRPLIGTWQAIEIIPASLSNPSHGRRPPLPPQRTSNDRASLLSMGPRKKDVSSFNDLLMQFPMIARQMQPGLDRFFREFSRVFEKPLPPTPPGLADIGFEDSLSEPQQGTFLAEHPNNTTSSTNGHAISPLRYESGHIDDDEDIMRQALETAVTAAIDLFQLVDKQQLSLLGATTDLTGPVVERLIERYVTEQLHESTLFPRLIAIKRAEDLELEYKIRQMENVDISQIGIPITGGAKGKRELIFRISKAVEEFAKIAIARSPQEMIGVLLATEKAVTLTYEFKGPGKDAEKANSVLTINADVLVSLLLIVVIRSKVRYLQARLAYMRHFIFIDDVEGGELGYALSTFEAVLSYLARDSGGLRRASRRNKKLWHATQKGDVDGMKSILEPDAQEEEEVFSPDKSLDVEQTSPLGRDLDLPITNGNILDIPFTNTPETYDTSETSSLNHVFPFQINHESVKDQVPIENEAGEIPRVGKRVSLDIRSFSSSSGFSNRSRATTLDSMTSGIEGDTSIERLTKTQDWSGESIPMMAVEHRQPNALKYLLSLKTYYTLDSILEDVNNEGTTLLSAAVQLGNVELIDILLDFILHTNDYRIVMKYLEMEDDRGRTAAHYLFNAPYLINRIGRLLPWRRKDRNGQTPLFALCRSYDHPNYKEMVDHALTAATKYQPDGLPLHLDEHIDVKGNTLLHIVSDPQLSMRILSQCDSDLNSTNEKKFTPIMVASKYGRVDLVRVLFSDPRIDIFARELRGLTAVELAKDDEVRNGIDDLMLFTNSARLDGRITAVVRSYFVEDASIRLVLKSGAPSVANSTFAVTTCRRTLTEFENLAKWLSIEHPASWLPSISDLRTPYQIPSKPSRAVLRDIQVRLDNFLKILLSHSTFSTHEMLWEFFLVPEIRPEMMAERSEKKAETRVEKIREEYSPVDDVRDVELFIGHARETVRGVNQATKSVLRRLNSLIFVSSDLCVAHTLSATALSTTPFLPPAYLRALSLLSLTLQPLSTTPYATFFADMQALASTIAALLTSLTKPASLIASMAQTSKAIDRHLSSLRRSDRWPLGLLDETRAKIHDDAAERVERSRAEYDATSRELRWTQQTVAAELSAWQESHALMARQALKKLAQGMVVGERARLQRMRSALRDVVPWKREESAQESAETEPEPESKLGKARRGRAV
ncbi:MAG: hypothetical protein M1829_000157 [Trizodia sp. TS-e1964]|nr:MAG: hypothetical protein M1829_000157 [Trizodia sp. TS-e1964]